MTDSFDALIRRLIEENEIDVPIVDIRVVGGKIAFYLYNGELIVCEVRKDCVQKPHGAQTLSEEVKIAL